MSGDQRLFILIEEPEREDDPPRIKLVRWPRGKPGRTADFLVPTLPDFDEPGEDAATLAREHGDALLKALCQVKTLKVALDDALNASRSEVRPLCFKVEGEAPDSMGICWEALWAPSQEFLALKRQWPIGRVVESELRPTRVFEPPLRILAVMSGVGLKAREEWDALYRAVEMVQRKKLAVQVTLVLGEEELAEEARALADSTNWLDVILMEDENTILRILDDPFPHIVHFFCHGSVRHGEGSLEFATITDHDGPRGRKQDSVSVNLSDLANFVAVRKPWFVVLNCCESAPGTGSTTADEIQSLAREVVASGAAAAIGWRHTISPADAYALTDTVYQQLLPEFATRLNQASKGASIDLELASLASGARGRLATARDRDQMRWTLPVLFVTPDPLSVVVHKKEPDHPTDHSVSEIDAAQRAEIAKIVRDTVLEAAARLSPQVSEALAEYRSEGGTDD